MHECVPKLEQREWNKTETNDGGKRRGVSMERNKAGIKERSPDSLSLPNQNTIIINIIW